MSKPFLEIASLDEKEQKEIIKDIEDRIEKKKKEGLLTGREIKEIENMEPKPLPDIQEVQSVYEDFMYREKKPRKKERS